ncbi:MAG: alpha/beta hydrolase [Humibacillus sp.]|nr:alpha/beta hydrolase [Humibacillus sp.]MDN5776074.1 alpha/beta hydrolase [Humibacillus sp.]
MKSTIILVHGAFADSSSWDGVIAPLTRLGHTVIAFANPLRGVATDAALLTDLVASVDGPLVLVGHSYGGAVMTNVDASGADVVGLVYVAGFALKPGESCGDASALAPGSTLGDTLAPVPLAGGGSDLYIDQGKYHHQFAADLSPEQAATMAVTQRPVTEAALYEPSGDRALWREVPSWFIFGELDRNIPAGAHHVMADRAGSRGTVEVAGASHVVGISHPDQTIETILAAVGANVGSTA